MTGSLHYGRKGVLLGAWVLLALLLCIRSQAQIYVHGPSLTPHGSNYTFTYDLTLSNNAVLHYGDYVTIYDFHGLVPGTNFQYAGWMFSSAMIGRTPSRILPIDSSSYPNLTWTYTGTTPLRGPLDLGLFGADSTSSRIRTTDYVSQVHLNDPGQPGNGRPMLLLAFTGDTSSARVPSHRWWAMLPLGLLPLGLLLRLRRGS